jgi:energy-coupling factor transporter ATP-binding protein EcfA2
MLPMLSYFRVVNYKCLERVEFPLTPIHVLIGPNDSGKTSVLEAMLAYMRSTHSPVEQVHRAVPGGSFGKELVYHGAPKDGPITFTGMGDRALAPRDAIQGIGPPWDLLGYGLSLTLAPQDQLEVAKEWTVARRAHGGKHPKGAAEETETSLSSETNPSYTMPTFLISKGVDPETHLKLPHGLFGLASLYRFDPKVLAIPAMPDVNRKYRMDPDGFGLATLLDDILGYDAELFLALRREFCEFFPQFKSVRLETATAYIRQYEHEGVHSLRQSQPGKEILFETRLGGTVRARQASEGVLLFLAFLALVYLPPPHRPKLVLLEEPERGVYPKKLGELIQSLKKWGEGGSDNTPQIVLTTHSPYVLTWFTPEEVTFLSRMKGGGVRARPLRDAPNIHARLEDGFYLGELWYNLTEEDLFGDESG